MLPFVTSNRRSRARPLPGCVLVPGAGGAAAIGTIKALRRVRYRGRIVTTDVDPLAPGFMLADAAAILPPAHRADFLPHALDLIRRERVEVILPTSGFDTVVYARHTGALRAAGVTVVGCSPEVMDLCLDKWRFHQHVAGRFPVPETHRTVPAPLAFPCFVKPVRGKRSSVPTPQRSRSSSGPATTF